MKQGGRDEYIVVGQAERDKLPQNFFADSISAICKCTTCFIIGDSPAGSGTLVSIEGRNGILTAHHVAKEAMTAPEGSLSICIKKDPHRPEISQRQLLPRQIGKESDYGNNSDLSFIEINDTKLIASIAEDRSFFNLNDGEGDIISSIQVFRKGGFWRTAGAPKEFCRRVPDRNGVHLFKVGFLCGDATYCHNGNDPCSNLDELTLKVPINGNHPKDYDGMSGGGIWLIYLNAQTESPDSLFCPKAILVGVIREQSVKPESDTRKIYAYGPKAIYKEMRLHFP